MNPNNLSENKYFKRGISLIIVMIITYLLVPILLTALALYSSFKNNDSFANCLKELVTATGPLGDTLGGTMGPIVAIIAALLTYWAFMEQVKANKQQANQFNIQFNHQANVEFENRFFELLNSHRALVAEINDKVTLRNGFRRLFEEFRYLKSYVDSITYDNNNSNFSIVRENLLSENIDEENIEKEKTALNKSALIFCFTGEPNYSYEFMSLQGNSKLGLSNIDGYPHHKIKKDLNNGVEFVDPFFNGQNPEGSYYCTVERGFTFTGHFFLMRKYFVNLNQLINFVISQDTRIVKEIDNYMEIIRSELSKEELALTYLFSFTDFNWLSEKTILEGKVLKYFPYKEVDFSFNARSIYLKKIKTDISEFLYFSGLYG